jgi:serine/threonine protein phosphatase PrpC
VLALRSALRSDTGRRANNEDAVYASPRLAAVADGVGGHAAGEIASGWAIQALMALDKSRLAAPLDVALRDWIAWGNETIGFVAGCRPDTAGMSTTLTAVALDPDDVYVLANIGDSRTYLLRDGALSLLSRDDSLVQELVDAGHITPAQARRHPSRSLVLEALDGDPGRAPSIRCMPARLGDRLLLCSDGLSDVLEDEALETVLAAHADAGECADRLVELALEAGARDNVSVVVADVTVPRDPSVAWQPALTL